MTTIYIIVQHWPNSRRKMDSAYLSEDAARLAASKLVGRHGAMVALETVDVMDLDGPTLGGITRITNIG